MQELSISEMWEKLDNLDQLIKMEGEILVTRRGVPIARLLPMKRTRTRPDHYELRARMQKLNTPSETLVREDRDQR